MHKNNTLTLDFVKFYLDLGFSVIPLKSNSKQPLVAWSEFQQRKAADDEVQKWFGNGTKPGIGIVTGSVSRLIVVDADTQETIEFLEQYKVFQETAKVKTKRGKHYYFYITDGMPDTFGTQKIYKNNIKIDVKANGGYVVAPPSIVDGHTYEWQDDDIKEITFEKFADLIKQIKEKLEIDKEQKEIETQKTGKIDFEKLKGIILRQYTEGKRQDLCMYLAGWLRKEGFSQDEVEQLITDICISVGDRDIKQRLSAVEHTFKEEDLSQLKGLSGFEELGFTREELYSAIGKENDDYEPLGEGFYEKEGLLFYGEKAGKKKIYKMLGPKIEIKAKVYDGSDIAYEVGFGDRVDYLKEVKDLEKIRRLTGLAVVKESKYLEWLNYEILKCTQRKYIRKATGWHKGTFYHPAIQTEDIWEQWFWWKKVKTYQNKTNRQHELIREALRDARGLAVVYCFSLASVLNEILNTNPSVMFISGHAHVGKTTLAQLGVNLFIPAEDVFITSHSTAVGMELLLRSLKDITVLFDECVLKDLDLEKIVFMVASRVGKVRGTKSLSINVSDIASNVLFTSEVMEQSTFRRAGAQRRFLSLVIEDFQKSCFSKMKVDEIQKCRKWFGAGVDIIRYIQSNQDKVKELSETVEVDIEKAKLHSLYHIALPLLTATKVFEDFYGEKFKNAYDMCMIHVYEQKKDFEQKIDLIGRFRDDFSQFLVRKSNQIVDVYNAEKKSYGEIIGQKEGINIFILTKAFSEFCNEHGFEQKILTKELIKHNILKPYSYNAPRTPKKIAGVLASTYHIILNPPETE